jgi:nucleotide-sensitive chloride channel 1A
MPPTTIRSAPALDSFVSLEDHQSQTPASFYGAKPVLHHHIARASVIIARDQISKLPVFHSADAALHGAATSVGSSTAGEEAPVEDGHASMGSVTVDVFVSSE